MSKKELGVVQRSESGLVLSDLDEADAGMGFENQTSDDRSTPWFKLLQSGSPECKNKNRVEGALPGMFFNQSTKELFPAEGVEVTICTTERVFVEWKPDGAGFAGRHEKNSKVYYEAKNYSAAEGFWPWRLPNGNELVETVNLYLLIPSKNGIEPVVMPISSTKFKTYSDLMDKFDRYRVELSNGKLVKPPMCIHRIKLSSFDDEGKGNEFSGLLMEGAANNNLDEGMLKKDDPRYIAGKLLAQQFKEGKVEVDYDAEKGDDTEGAF